jgi:O-antigen/teichoic acid export membrane protein
MMFNVMINEAADFRCRYVADGPETGSVGKVASCNAIFLSMSSAPKSLVTPHVRSWSWALAGQTSQVLGQAIAFILVARALPVGDMGVFIGITALTSILAPFTGIGAGNLLIKYVARERTAFVDRWSKLLGTTLLSGSALCFLAALVCRVVVREAVPWYAIVLLVISDLLLWRWPYLVGLALQGLGEFNRKSQLEIVVVCMRLAAATLLFALPSPYHQVRVWLVIYFGAACIVCGVSLAWTLRQWGMPEALRAQSGKELKEGLWFVVSPATQTINNDVDKLLLARMASLSVAGVYGAAYRVLSASFLPVQALLTVTYPRFFQQGSKGVRETGRYAARWLPLALGYSMAAGVALFAAAPVLTMILGPDYAQSATIVRQLAVLPLLKAFQYFLADALTGADFQALRVGLQCIAALLNVALNLLWIPRFGWQGAVWATLICDGGLALLLFMAVMTLRRYGERPW